MEPWGARQGQARMRSGDGPPRDTGPGGGLENTSPCMEPQPQPQPSPQQRPRPVSVRVTESPGRKGVPAEGALDTCGSEEEQAQPRGGAVRWLVGAAFAATAGGLRAAAGVTRGTAGAVMGAQERLWGAARAVVASTVAPAADIAGDVARHWIGRGVDTISPLFVRQQSLLQRLHEADTYDEFRAVGLELDRLSGAQRWKMGYECPDYDYELVRDRLNDLYQARKEGDRAKSVFLLRSSLLRNLGGMGNEALFARCYVGTKDLIEQYVDEVVYQLYQLQDLPTSGPGGMSQQDKVDMLVATRQAFGRSALLLSGGGGLGLHHFGVIKALYDAGVMPRIVSGSSAGALIAAMICSFPEHKLAQVLGGEFGDISSSPFFARNNETWFNQIDRFFRCGVLADINVLKETTQNIVGDVTFQEAYETTGRILNITVNPTSQNDIPRLLNYLTAPHVLIWSAACASCALGGLFVPSELLVKGKDGKHKPWSPLGQQWTDGSVAVDLPMKQLREQFDVNHFIVAQVNPHVVPMLGIQRRFPQTVSILVNELLHRFRQLEAVGLLPSMFTRVRSVAKQHYRGDITIVPRIPMDEYLSVVTNPTPERFRQAMRAGQLATWKRMSLILAHTKIELALDDIVGHLRGSELWKLT